ncbi:predicted protein [Streptomyces viridochromogenes DSM 40736]|uniref:Predicted protein n=1 Tax=Streptomyces viridochromogenes (strain DSM 40736 / JCM 4977 / BCRC 1201 / Tue 494) TaxID=591159 RepID=D9X717_STRVT|nr:hypothetical protein [Streptomyces viridochromogenes]EFL34084.1 predicted protein [Streptomyces viridochromogenes DSM 40736]
MFSPASKYGIAGATLALWALTACGSSSGSGGDDPTTAPATRQAAEDKGPQCVGVAAADGVHVLRGGGFRLPGGGGVQYAGAAADGTSRTATLRDGARYGSGQQQWTVKPGSPVTVSGHAYTVRQVCSYRVVLEPKDAKEKAALAAAPESMKFAGGSADNALCFTTNRAVLAAAAKSFPAKGQTLSLLDNGGVKQLPTGPSLTVSYIDTTAGTAGLGANCAGVPVALYKDVRVGDTVELAGVLFKVSGLTEQAVRLTRTSG